MTDWSSLVDGFRAKAAWESPAGLGRLAFPRTWQDPPHLVALNAALRDVAAGKTRRLLVCMPPRHAKSTMVSRVFPAWFLGRFPDRRVILAGYGDAFAATWGRAARDLLEAHGGLFGVRVSPGSAAANRWDLAGRQGGLIAAGVGGAITGRGADVLIVDDPVKSAEEAASALLRDRVETWYRETAYTRLEPGGAVVLVMTRWHLDDLAGRLLAAAASGAGEPWTELRLPALAGPADPLGRAEGEALWPARYDAAALAGIRAELGSRAWAALYQQSPVADGGGLFRRAWFPAAAAPADLVAAVRYWDLAATAARPGADPDWSAGALVGVDAAGTRWVLDVARFRASPAEAEARLRAVAEADGRGVLVVVEQEPGSAGAYLAEHLQRRVLAGFAVRAERPTGPKALRAAPFAAAAEAGRVRLAPGAWHADLLAELEAFPFGAHDDQVDAVAGAYAALAATPLRRRDPSLLDGRFAFGGPRGVV